ncbi:hypothetical protein E2C01_086540 [Portunus trituberculatus]|uniref:Uncharacterized protein n=1 Tax=Portunus trituberculatus TaxID=210409 RepID=A0A5B7J9K3_PORTR|nr:hypothetical protein [Portunus trituberculatus]
MMREEESKRFKKHKTKLQTSKTKHKLPSCHHRLTATTNLRHEGHHPDAVEERVAGDALKDVVFPVDLPGVDLIEERHHHEGVEDEGEVLRRRLPALPVQPVVYVQHDVACRRFKDQIWL